MRRFSTVSPQVHMYRRNFYCYEGEHPVMLLMVPLTIDNIDYVTGIGNSSREP